MAHALETIIRNTDKFVIIGDSSEKRFPAMSYHSYTKVGKQFYCLDLGGLKESRGFTKGGKIYHSVEELPDDRSDLAIIWVKPRSAANAVEIAHKAGAKRIWFNFKTGHPTAVNRAKALDMEVVEIGRCPVLYMDEMVPACRAHTLAVKLTGTYKRPPQTDPHAKRREML